LSAERTPESERWLLLRNDANHQIKYALSNAPEEIPMKELIEINRVLERQYVDDQGSIAFRS
jgi:hypothetical protein